MSRFYCTRIGTTKPSRPVNVKTGFGVHGQHWVALQNDILIATHARQDKLTMQGQNHRYGHRHRNSHSVFPLFMLCRHQRHQREGRVGNLSFYLSLSHCQQSSQISFRLVENSCKMPGGKNCCVVGCTNYNSKTSQVSYVSFPRKNKDKFTDEWRAKLIAVCRTDVKFVPDTHRICTVHFEPKSLCYHDKR